MNQWTRITLLSAVTTGFGGSGLGVSKHATAAIVGTVSTRFPVFGFARQRSWSDEA
jgi:hypothetical protein